MQVSFYCGILNMTHGIFTMTKASEVCMDYDLWKSGWYDAEPDINHEEYCSHNHKENGESLKELIEELHSSDELNLEFVQEQLEWLARDYGIDFDFTRPLCLARAPIPSFMN